MLRHPRLSHALIALRPGAKPLVDFIVDDLGDGPTLREGSMLNPPTQEEVDALTVEQLDEAQASKAPKDLRIQLLADVASLKERLEIAETAVADVASIKDRLQVAELAVADVATIKDRLAEVEKTREPPVIVVHDPVTP